jgi:hypothetical protein
MMPDQNDGSACITSVIPEIARSAIPPGARPARTPSSGPISSASAVAVTVSTRVAGKRSRMTVIADSWKRYDSPKSPVTASRR